MRIFAPLHALLFEKTSYTAQCDNGLPTVLAYEKFRQVCLQGDGFQNVSRAFHQNGALSVQTAFAVLSLLERI